MFQDSKTASETLNEYGIKGITYEGGMDGRCYVVFDDEAVEITARFSVNLSEGNKDSVDNSEKVGDNDFIEKNIKKHPEIPDISRKYIHRIANEHSFINHISKNDDVDSLCDKLVSDIKEKAEVQMNMYREASNTSMRAFHLNLAAECIGVIDTNL